MLKTRILNVFPASEEGSRLVVARETDNDSIYGGDETLVLRQESFSEHVGWFVQSRIVIDACQLAGLKATLSCQDCDQRRESVVSSSAPSIIRFPGAVAG